MTSLFHLEILWKFKQEQLEQEIEKFIFDWNKNYKCNCCKYWKIGDGLIECKHIEKEKIKKFGDRNLQQFKSILFLRGLSFQKTIHS